MGERRVLVIGSQCEGAGHLSFLPTVAEDLYAVLTDPTIGGWVPALPEGGLLLDPAWKDAHGAIEAAYRQASEAEATLLFAFIGHGAPAGGDFFLLPYGAPLQPMAHTAVHIVQLIKDLHRRYSDVDGLVVLLDACYAGVAASGAAAQWVGELAGTLRFEMLTAVADRTAADGCFSRTLAEVLRAGIRDIDGRPVGGTIRCEDVRPILIHHCKAQLPQLPAYNADAGLFLAKNVAFLRHQPPCWESAGASEIERLTRWFQPTPQLRRIVDAAQSHRCVALLGDAGSGKSTLAAALVRPDVDEGKVPAAFVQAIVFISEAVTTELLARDLAGQLERAVPDFAAAAASFEHSLIWQERERLDPLERRLIGPLRWLKAGEIRIVIDGLDRLPDAAETSAYKALVALASDPELAWLHLLVTARPDTSIPPGAHRIDLERADDGAVRSYLGRRKIGSPLHEPITERAAGNWLVARLLADLAAADPDVDPKVLPGDLGALYAGALQRAGAASCGHWRSMLRPVLTVLAAAGVGPVLPLPLLCAASGALGGPERVSRVRDVLVDLTGFVSRSFPGTEAEHVGLFHQTLAEYLLDPSQAFGSEPQEAHQALAEALEASAPMDRHNRDDPVHRYAAIREAEHLWVVGQHERALESLERRPLSIPLENLRRWQQWLPLFQSTFGPDHPITLATRNNLAFWIGETGQIPEALRLSEALLSDLNRVLGPDDARTLKTRNNIGNWTAQIGDVPRALRLFEALLSDQMRVLGPDHPDTLITRNHIAFSIGETDRAGEALWRFVELLPECTRVLGPSDPLTLLVRNNIAHWTGWGGNAAKALELFHDLLPDRISVLGPDHTDTLVTRLNIAAWTGMSGDTAAAVQLFKALLPDMIRLRGLDDPYTLTIRYNIAYWTLLAGDAPRAMQLFKALLPDQVRVFGFDHSETQSCRDWIAHITQGR